VSYWDTQGQRSARGAAFRPSPIFLGIVALFIVTAIMTWTEFGNVRIDVFLFVLAGWVVSLCLHEYAHALSAYLSGDRSVASRGYLTLNPLKYTHPFLSIVLPLIFVILGGIGLPGGAVWVDHGAIRSRVRDSLISFAGPATNLVFTFALTIPIALFATSFGLHTAFWGALAFLAFLQLTATLINFLPIPGIDGGNIYQPWLSPQGQRAFQAIAPWGFVILFALLWSPVLNRYFFDIVFAIGNAIGLPDYLVSDGDTLFRFWSF
jgi:Zn-dependent protease